VAKKFRCQVLNKDDLGVGREYDAGQRRPGWLIVCAPEELNVAPGYAEAERIGPCQFEKDKKTGQDITNGRVHYLCRKKEGT
jgi:hypothetical protein